VPQVMAGHFEPALFCVIFHPLLDSSYRYWLPPAPSLLDQEDKF
jgi:hypothetical protein